MHHRMRLIRHMALVVLLLVLPLALLQAVTISVLPSAVTWTKNSPIGGNLYAIQTLVLSIDTSDMSSGEELAFTLIEGTGGITMKYGSDADHLDSTVGGNIWLYSQNAEFVWYGNRSHVFEANTAGGGKGPIRCVPDTGYTTFTIEFWIRMYNDPYLYDPTTDIVWIPALNLKANLGTLKDDGSTAFVPDSIVHIQVDESDPDGEESVPLVWQDPANVTPGSGGGSNIDPNPDVWDFGIGSSLAKSVQEDIDFYQLSTGTMINVGAVTATHVSGDSTENSEVTVRFYPDDLVFDYGTNSTRKAFSYALFFGDDRIVDDDPEGDTGDGYYVDFLWDNLSPSNVINSKSLKIQYDSGCQVLLPGYQNATLDALPAGTYSSTIRIEFITGT